MGHGVLTFAGGDVYQGTFKDDKMHGNGVYTWQNGAQYDGEWKNDEKHGTGWYKKDVTKEDRK